MKTNMEKAVQRAEDKAQKKKTLRQIDVRDRDHKEGKSKDKRRRQNTTQLVKGQNRSQQDITDIRDDRSPRQRERRKQEILSPSQREKQRRNQAMKLINASPSNDKNQRSSPRFRDNSGSSDDLKDFTKSERNLLRNNDKDKRKTAVGRQSNQDDEDSDGIVPAPPTLQQIQEQHRLNSLKVVDIYRQLQNSPLLAVHDLKENPTIAAEVELSNLNNDSVRKNDQISLKDPLLTHQARAMTNAARNPTNDDIITSTFVHVLSAFAIAESQQDIFLRIKTYLVMNGYELPKLNGIYNSTDFQTVRRVKTSYLHTLFSQSLQTAIHANWIAMAHSILIHCKEMHIQVSVSKMDLSVLLGNATFDLMNLLIEYGAYFDRNDRSIEAEKMHFKEVPKVQGEETDTEEEEFEKKWRNNENAANQTGFKKVSSITALSKGSRVQGGKDDYSRALTNLDQTMFSMRSQRQVHETTMLQNLKRGLVAGHSQLNASHFVRQLYDDRQALGPKAENHERFQKQVRALLKALSESFSFEQVIPLLVLRGSRDLVYDMLTDKKSSQFNFELTFQIQKQLALEFFCFSVSQEQLDEAINVFLKFRGHLTINHRKRCVHEVMEGLKRSAAFIELKFYLLSQFYNRMTQSEAIDVLDIIENRHIATYMHQSAHRAVLLQNINSLRTSLLTLFMMGKISKLIPHSEKRVATLYQKVIDNMTDILDRTPHTDFDKIILSANRKDIFNNDALYYLAFTKPGDLLNCQVIQKLIDQHWSSSYFSASTTALLHHSSCSQIIFHSKLKTETSVKHLLLGNSTQYASSSLAEASEHLITAVNFQAWRKGINVRFTLDCLLTFILIAFLQYLTIEYMDGDKKLDVDGPIVSFLMYWSTIANIQQVNQISYSGFYVAYSYCFAGSAYFLLSILCKGILSHFYLMHTGFKGHQHISLTEYIVFIVVACFGTFYYYMATRTPEYYEPLEEWGEIIDDPYLLDFYANLRNFDDDEDLIVSVRFGPFLVITALWIYFFSRLQMHRGIGSYVIMLRLAASEFAKFLTLWLISLLFFGGVTVVWLGEYSSYSTVGQALESLYLTSFGLQEWPVEIESGQKTGIQILHAAFVIINLIGFLSFLTAMMTQTLVQSRSKINCMQHGYFIERLPKERYSEKVGWIATVPLLLAPFFLFFVYPLHLFVMKVSSGAKKHTWVICAILYFPVCLAQLIIFIVLNLSLIPFAYIAGIYQLITMNPYQDRKFKRNKFLLVLIFFLFGIPFLLICQFTNAWYCLKSLYAPKINSDALASEKHRQAPVNTRNVQRMYQSVSKELLEISQTKFSKPSDQSKQLLERMRNSFGIQNCVKMLFFGSIPGFSSGSAKFMGQLKREDQTITSQLECYNILKSLVLAHKDINSNELNIGLLFQYLQEIKMNMTTMKSLENHRSGKELRQIEFVTISRSSKTDEIAREILQANPQLTLRVLQAEEQASQGLKDSFIVTQLNQMQIQILAQMKRQALSAQLLQGVPLDQLRDNQSLISHSEMPTIAQVPLETDRSRRKGQINQYQLAIAQQEAVYGIARLMQTQKVTKEDIDDTTKQRAASRTSIQLSAAGTLNEAPFQPVEDKNFKPTFLRKKTMTVQ